MKAVLMSIQPKWCELIASGKKTIEIRKTRPKLETPFKCYIYCTKGGEVLIERKDLRNKAGKYPGSIYERVSGKVIGEFVCDRIDEYNTSWLDGEDKLKKSACIDDAEIMDYMGGYLDRKFYAWHISELKIYDKPKELGEFYIANHNNIKCEYKERGYNMDFCTAFEKGRYFCKSLLCDKKKITRPPQSWYYVEEI